MKYFNLTAIVKLFFPFCFIISCAASPPLNTQKMLRISTEMKSREHFYGNLITKLYCYNSLNDSVRTEDSCESIQEVIKTELEYFFALQFAIKHSINNLLQFLLNWERPFSLIDDEIDFFILVLIPDLVESGCSIENCIEVVNALFTGDLRGSRSFYAVEITELSMKIGSFSSYSILSYLKHLPASSHGTPTKSFNLISFP